MRRLNIFWGIKEVKYIQTQSSSKNFIRDVRNVLNYLNGYMAKSTWLHGLNLHENGLTLQGLGMLEIKQVRGHWTPPTATFTISLFFVQS